MSAPRLVPAVLLLLAACAGWETSSPNQGPPPADSPAPSSHYVPPAPDAPPAPDDSPGAPASIRVAIASVQLLDNCPDPAEQKPRPEGAEEERAARPDGDSAQMAKRACAQSTVQLALRSDRAGPFRIEAVRVLEAAGKRVAGSSTLRGPTQWGAQTSTYQRWDERVAAGEDLQISYKLGELDLSAAGELVGDRFDTYAGPFMLELDVSVGGERRTIRSPEFGRQRDDLVET